MYLSWDRNDQLSDQSKTKYVAADPTLTTNDSFGYSVALDQQYLLVGAPDDDTIGLGVGQARLYSLTTGELVHTFNDPTPIIVDNFGTAVALNRNRVSDN